jgi:hypothetical protein
MSDEPIEYGEHLGGFIEQTYLPNGVPHLIASLSDRSESVKENNKARRPLIIASPTAEGFNQAFERMNLWRAIRRSPSVIRS